MKREYNKILCGLLLSAFVLITWSDVYGENVEFSVLSTGYVEREFSLQSLTINDEDSFNTLLKQLNKDKGSVKVDFVKEVVSFIVVNRGRYPDHAVVNKVYRMSSDRIGINYFLNSVHYVPEKDFKPRKPYLMVKLKTSGGKIPQVSFRDTNSKGIAFVAQSLDSVGIYTNTLSEQDADAPFVKYLALDTGNVWTYEYKSDGVKGYQTSSIVSYTQNWSVFDSFFGKNNIAMKIGQQGELFVYAGTRAVPFYPKSVKINYQKKSFKIKAGKFKNVLIISSRSDSPITFKDVYAKGIGLIYHEHSSPKGSATYSLTSARVGGRNIQR